MSKSSLASKLSSGLKRSLGKGSKHAHSSETSKPIPRVIVGSTPVPKLSVSVYASDMDTIDFLSDTLRKRGGIRTPSRSGVLRAAARLIEKSPELLEAFITTYTTMVQEDDGRSLRKLNRLAVQGQALPTPPKKKAKTKAKR